jgi:hypothetical protein
MTIYYEGWKEQVFNCEECGWTGDGNSCKPGTMYRKIFLELYCPSCDEVVDIIDFSSFKGCDKGHAEQSDEQKKALAEQEELEARQLALCLQSPDQLPDLPDDDFVLIWDQKDGDTLIMKDGLAIWSEPVTYEGFIRFERIAVILKGKYGSSIKDLAPTERSKLFLYGDYLPSLSYVRKIRKELFGVIAEKEF